METWPFPFYSVSVDYPRNATTVQFGRSYTFTARATSPPQRLFTLKLMGMTWFLLPDGTPTLLTTPERNVFALIDFYERHNTSESFLWVDQGWGTLEVRFRDPLKIPEGMKGGSGVIEMVEVRFEEQP